MSLEQKIILQLKTRSGNIKDLTFKAHATPIAQKWLETLKLAQQTSQIRERQRIYNFPTTWTQAQILAEIERCLNGIDSIFPGLINAKIDPHSVQESINRIHLFFADTKDTSPFENPKAHQLWNDLNNALHAFESKIRSEQTFALAGIPEANIVVTWEDSGRRELELADYEHFTVAKKFGTCYINYCQIGRHLYEMFLADDQVAHDEHIEPLRFYGADTYIWLGTTTGPQTLKKRQENIEHWFQKHETRLNSLGWHWGDPKLAIGWIPVAQLETAMSPEQCLKELSDIYEVQGFRQVP